MNLIDIFEDTQDKCKLMKFTSETSKYDSGDILRFVTTYPMRTKKDNENIKTKVNIFVENSDSVTSLSEWSKSGKTCVLNMASFKKPGGGVRNGAKAQEEDLFRCSNLSSVVSSDFYPLDGNVCLYTKDAVFFKDCNYDYMDQVVCDAITIPAVNLNKSESSIISPGLYEKITKDKIRLMLSIAHKNDVKNIILGAWGCGVFKNDPDKMANFFKEVFEEGYSNFFDNIIFAIINDHNSVGDNFDIFSKVFPTIYDPEFLDELAAIKYLKNAVIKHQKYELVAMLRDKEVALMSKNGVGRKGINGHKTQYTQIETIPDITINQYNYILKYVNMSKRTYLYFPELETEVNNLLIEIRDKKVNEILK